MSTFIFCKQDSDITDYRKPGVVHWPHCALVSPYVDPPAAADSPRLWYRFEPQALSSGRSVCCRSGPRNPEGSPGAWPAGGWWAAHLPSWLGPGHRSPGRAAGGSERQTPASAGRPCRRCVDRVEPWLKNQVAPNTEDTPGLSSERAAPF